MRHQSSWTTEKRHVEPRVAAQPGQLRLQFVASTEGGPGWDAARLAPHVGRRGWKVSELWLPPDGVPVFVALRAWRGSRVQRRQADIVHVELGKLDLACFWYALLAALAGARVSVTGHDAPEIILHPAAGLIPLRPRVLSTLAYRVLCPLFDRPLVWTLNRLLSTGVVLSDGAVERWRRAGGPRLVGVMPHGAEPRGPQGPPSEGEGVLMAGFLGPGKGVDVLLAAWSEVAPTAPLPLWIMGSTTDGTGSGWLRELQSKSAAQPNAPVWLGSVSDDEWRERFRRAAIVVLPYRVSNPASGPLVKAMVEGRAIIISRVVAADDLIADGETGVLVAPEDSEELACALSLLLEDLSLRDRLGDAAGRAAADRFTWAGHAAGLDQALRTAIARTPRRRCHLR